VKKRTLALLADARAESSDVGDAEPK